MINVSNNYKQALTQPRTIDAKITYDSTTINIDDINSIKRSFNSTLFKTIAKQVIIDSNVSINKDITINPQFGLYLDNQFEYVSLGSYKVKDAPNLNKDTNSYEITAYDKIVDSMVDYALTGSDITYPCSVRDLFVAIFTKLGWFTSGIPSTFVNSSSMIEEDVYSNVNMTYRDVLDELCTISCMFLIDVNGTPTLKQKTTTSETINEDFMSDTNVQIKNQVFFNSLVFSRASNSDNIYRKDDTSIANNGLHEFKVSDLQILSLNWRDNFIDAMWNYIKTFTYYAYEVNTNGITYLEPIDTFTLSTFGSTYSTILLNSDLTIANGVNEKIYANEPIESETEYKYADTTDKRINQTNLIVDKQNGRIDAVVSQVDEIEQDLQNPTSTKEGEYFDLEDALDSPLIDFSLYGNTSQSGTPTPSSPQEIHNVSGDNTINICGKNLFDGNLKLGNWSSSDGSFISNSSYIVNTNPIRVKPNTNYIFSINGSGIKMYLFEYKKDGTYNLTERERINGGAYFTTKSDTYYINFRTFDNNTDTTSKIQVEKGTSIGEYEAYQGNSQLISLGNIELNKISTYQDYIYKNSDKWYLHKEIGKVVLDGSENWNNDGGTQGTDYRHNINLNRLNISTPININKTYISNYFTSRNIASDVGELGTFYLSNIWLVFVDKNKVYDLENWKTWLSTHNTIVYYVLATPTDTEITGTLLEQLNRLMTLPLYKNMTHITIEPNDLTPIMNIEYVRDTAINSQFVRQPQLNNYYTRTETTAQINISNSSIKSDVAEIQTTLDENGNAINIISNQVQNLQTSTSKQINIINEQLENGVEKVKTTTGYTFDNQGLGITKGEEFKNLITDRNQQISSNNKEIMFMGYDDDLKKTVARIPELESRQATIGLHRTETIYEDNMYWTAEFYVGGGN